MNYSWNQLALCRELILLFLEDFLHSKSNTIPKDQVINKVVSHLHMPFELVARELDKILEQKEKGPSTA